MTTPTPEFPDWSRPTSLVDSDRDVLNYFPGGSGGVLPYTSPEIDTSQAKSIRILASTTNSPGNGSLSCVSVAWRAGSVTQVDNYTFFDDTAGSPRTGSVYIECPVRGTVCTITLLTSSTAKAYAVFATLSTRAVLKETVQGFDPGNNSALVVATETVPANGTIDHYLPPVARSMAMAIGGGADTTTRARLSVGLLVAGVLGLYTAHDILQPLSTTTYFDLTFARQAVKLQWINSAAAGRAVSLRAWDTS